MRIIHTADLHLGVKFRNVIPRSAEGEKPIDIKNFVNEKTLDNFRSAVEYAVKNRADIFIVSGDIFETIEASLEYHTELADILNILAEKDIETVIIGGNHDYIRSPSRKISLALLEDLKYPNIIFKSRVDIAKDFKGDYPYIIEVNGSRVGLILLPYFWTFRREYERYIKLYISKMLARTSNVDYNILVAHLDLIGAIYKVDDFIGSFRSIEKVQVDNIYPDNFDYIALGHIHVAQKVFRDHIWYSGSLNRLNFGEYMDEKYFLDIDISERARVRMIKVDPIKMNVCVVRLDDIQVTWSNIRSRFEDILNKCGVKDSIVKIIVKVRTIGDYRSLVRGYEDKIRNLLWMYDVLGYYMVPEKVGIVDREYVARDIEIGGTALLKEALKEYIMKLPYRSEFKNELYRLALKYLGVSNGEDKTKEDKD